MSESQSKPGAFGSVIDHTAPGTDRRTDDVDGRAILSAVSDEYARHILELLATRPLSARELVERLDASRATVYRRLDRLESAGVVTSSMSIHPDGHHRKEFRIAADGVRIQFDADGVTVNITG